MADTAEVQLKFKPEPRTSAEKADSEGASEVPDPKRSQPGIAHKEGEA